MSDIEIREREKEIEDALNAYLVQADGFRIGLIRVLYCIRHRVYSLTNG